MRAAIPFRDGDIVNRHPAASDDNDGREGAPVATISRGVALAQENRGRGVGTKVLIAPGLYRDRVALPAGTAPTTAAPLVVEGAVPGQVVLSGSDVFAEWHRADGPENIYWHRWPYKWGPREQVKDPVWLSCGIVFRPILLRRETVYVNDELLRLVLSPLDLREGTCYVSEHDEKLIIWPARGIDARTALVEVPVRQNLFSIQCQRNLVVRGLVIRHDNSYYEQGEALSVGQGSTNIVVEDCRIEWNNSTGYGFNSVKDLTVRRVASMHNGGSGLVGCRLVNVEFEDTENSYNNWRGHWGEYYGWSVGGTKFLVVHNGRWTRNRSFGNEGLGFWFDTDCTDIVVDRCVWARNRRSGIFIEANQGPITIRDSVIAFNEHGVMSTNSSNINLVHNVLYGNRTAQIQLTGMKERPLTTWEWDGRSVPLTLTIQDWRLERNVIVGCDERQVGLAVSYADPELFVRTLDSHGNTWFNAQADRVVLLSGVAMALAEWQTTTGKDASSCFADPRFLDPDNLGFWFAEGGPLAPASAPAAAGSDTVFDAERARVLLLRKQVESIRANWETPFAGSELVPAECWQPLDLASVLNRPLRGAQGWLGVGGLSLEWLEGGRQMIQGVPFEVVDPTDGKPACMALRSFNVTKTGGADVPARVRVPVERRVAAVHILHGCGWAEHKKAGEYRLIYADGTTSTLAVIPYGEGSEHADVMSRFRAESVVQDWWPSLTQIENERLRHVVIADPGNPADKRYLYHLRWENPFPARSVAALEFESVPDLNTSLLIVAVTLEMRAAD